MKVTRNWLREYTPIDLPVDDLVAVLGDLGLAVESTEYVGGGLDGVVVARVVEIEAIEGADKIRLVRVDAGSGDGELVQVVCGAWNFAVGDLVPLATVGTVLPGDFAIARRKMKGVESHGMLCAPDELGLSGDHDGIMIVPGDFVPGAAFADAMDMTPDVVFELEINPNRPDAMSIVGVARDLAGRLGLPFSVPSPEIDAVTTVAPATVEVDDPAGCPRFMARVLTGVTVGPSPAWLAERLTLAGMRPINNVVDASNYVMLELGQPNHAYDLAKLPGRGLRVRRARVGETLVTLDEVERRFIDDDLLICDAEDRPVGIAGVMGGASSEVSATTTELLLEVAQFDPMTIAWTSKRLGLRSEASARFEKGIDPDGIERAAARFCELLVASGAATPGPAVDVRAPVRPRPPVRVRVERVNAVLGTELTDGQVKGYLDPIGFHAELVGPGRLDVTVPSWRPDSAVEIDVVEEVARMHGYAAIGKTLPRSTQTGRLTDRQRDRRLVRSALAGFGASEAWTTTFLAANDLERCGFDPAVAVVVANPLVADESLLRPSLLPGLLRSIAYNASHRASGVWLFEIGHTFRMVDRASLPDEREMLAVVLGGCEAPAAVDAWQVLADALHVHDARLDMASSDIVGLHPTRAAAVVVDGRTIGHLGEVDPAVLERFAITERCAWLELDLDALLASPHGSGQLVPVSRYPSSDVDLSFELDEGTEAGAVTRALLDAGVDVVVGVDLIDVYRGPSVTPGRRSVTYRVRLQACDRTLTDDELAAARGRLIDIVETRLPATLRA